MRRMVLADEMEDGAFGTEVDTGLDRDGLEDQHAGIDLVAVAVDAAFHGGDGGVDIGDELPIR